MLLSDVDTRFDTASRFERKLRILVKITEKERLVLGVVTLTRFVCFFGRRGDC